MRSAATLSAVSDERLASTTGVSDHEDKLARIESGSAPDELPSKHVQFRRVVTFSPRQSDWRMSREISGLTRRLSSDGTLISFKSICNSVSTIPW